MFALYLPKRRTASVEALREVGADWALDKNVAPMFNDVLEGGPDGSGGTLVYFDPPRPGQLNRIDLAAQRWEPAAPAGELEAGRYWIGIWKEHPPNPIDLERSTLCDGEPLTLLDGNQWIIPIADYLPKRRALNRQTGKTEERHLAENVEFVEETNAIFEHLMSDEFQSRLQEELRVVIPDGLFYAARALGKNYRVNVDLVDMLEIVSDFEATQIAGIATALDLVKTAENQKKTPLRALQNSDC